jgi:1,4-alpha-glucan branching enzyme
MKRATLAAATLILLLFGVWSAPARGETMGWLGGDPAASWARAPGFYREDGSWYAIIHTRPEVTRVRLAGEFTDEEAGAVDLARTPDGKFWWLEATDESFARPPSAGDRYEFILHWPDGSQSRTQDPAARWVESSDLSARSRVTVSSGYRWRDQDWARPGWEYYLIYQLHPLRFSDRNGTLTPLERVTEELDADGRDGKGWEMAQLAAAGTLLARGIPMLFMGQEGGESLQFGQDDGRLPPETAPTWWDDRLPLAAYEGDPGRAKVRNWYRRMAEIRRGDLGRLAAGDIAITHLHEQNGVVAVSRGGGKYVIVLNFKGGSWDRYDIGIRGRYQELANTSWPAFNLGGYAERTRGGDGAHEIADVRVPAYGAVVLVRWD